MNNKTEKPYLLIIIVSVLIIGFIGLSSFIYEEQGNKGIEEPEFETFNSQEEFSRFMSRTESNGISMLTTSSVRQTARITSQPVQTDATRLESTTSGDTASLDQNIRQTNVQVEGVGESDIVKLVGDTVYYSPEDRYGFSPPVIPEPRVATDSVYREPVDRNTRVLGTDNVPPEILDKLDDSGKLLRSGDTVVVYNDNKIQAYDVENEDEPEKSWDISVEDNSNIVTTRRIDNTAYFVIQERTQSCPVQPLSEFEEISCSEIYRPSGGVADSVYTAMSVNMENGSMKDNISFVGGALDTTVYMSKNNLYVGYPRSDASVDDLVNYAIDSDNVEFNNEVEERLETVIGYTLSSEAKQTEIQNIIRTYSNSLDEERQEEFMKNFEETTNNYIEENRRNMRTTQLVKISVEDGQMERESVGDVPGEPLNQFSFNEEDGKLRVATTIPALGDQPQTNDMYVLDNNMDVQGSVQDMADGQRIFAVRYIGDRGYIITFREVDPLHVINLEDASNPEEVGILELPGVSRYLHPVGDGKIVGVGQSQDNNGKVVLFDVTEDRNPKVADSVILESEFSTEVGDTHKAFMYDKEKNVMYVPGSSGLHIIGYSGDSLTEEGIIETEQEAKRTRIVDDKLYIFHNGGVQVADRDTYETLGGVGLSQR
jgi:uncharacterized secreted protein with C-terminal beta-propeller domain